MKRPLAFFTFIAAATALLAGEAPAQGMAEAQRPVIKIGVILPLTGNSAAVGEMAREGLLMRLEELRSQDGPVRYQVIFEDGEMVFSRTAAAVQKLKNIDHVNVIITLWGNGSSIALPILKDSDILHLNVDRWTEEQAPNDFVVGWSAKSMADKTLTLLKKLNYKRVVWFGTAEHGVEVLRKDLQTELPANGIEVVESLSSPAGAHDFRTWLLKVKEQNPDVILDCSFPPSSAVMLTQARELGLRCPIVYLTESCLQNDPTLTEGQLWISQAPANAAWRENFRQKYGKNSEYPAAQYYNVLSVLAAVCNRTQGGVEPTAAQLKEELVRLTTIESPIGTLHFSPPNRYEPPISYYRLRSGTPMAITLDETTSSNTK